MAIADPPFEVRPDPSRSRERRSVEPLPEGLPGALAEEGAYPQDASAAAGIETRQTHISHVFLTGERVYKLRKAVDLGFLDFSSRAARNADCLREVTLNRRLASDVYLGVAPVRTEGDGVRVGPVGEALAGDVEHVVVMRRLAAGRDALSLLCRGALTPAHVDAVAARVAAFHAEQGLGVPAPFEPEVWRTRIVEPVEENFASLARAAGRTVSECALERARRMARAFEDKQGWRFEARRREGRAVDGHGDLHLEHVWFEGDAGDPRLVDCIEFSERLRRIDAASDVAFLAMDLIYRGRRRLAERFLRRYARDGDDYDLYRVVDYFIAYRAGVRAKVAALAADEPEVPAARRERAVESARQHLALAVHALESTGTGGVVVVCGAVGTGKTTIAERVADVLSGAVISSDRVRKRLAGRAPTGRPGPSEAGYGRGIYTPEHTRRTYAALLERAEPVAASGRVAVLDATYARAELREDVRSWAEARGWPALLVEVRCAPEVARRRLARRRAEARDPSDAGPELHARSAAAFEPVEDWPAARRCAVDTDVPGWERRLRGDLCALWGEAAEAG